MLSNFKIHYKAIVIKTEWFWHTTRQDGELRDKLGHLISNKVALVYLHYEHPSCSGTICWKGFCFPWISFQHFSSPSLLSVTVPHFHFKSASPTNILILVAQGIPQSWDFLGRTLFLVIPPHKGIQSWAEVRAIHSHFPKIKPLWQDRCVAVHGGSDLHGKNGMPRIECNYPKHLA